MDFLNWDLYVLSRAIAYPNLSGAAPHIGLSQPQLSRIIVKLEDQYGVVLLDRDAKRKSGWTAEAFKLVSIYSNAARVFNADVKNVLNQSEPDYFAIGTLDGLAPMAVNLCQHLFRTTKIRTIDLQVLDLSALEEEFTKGNLDAIFSAREPGKKKFKHVETIGYQSLDKINESTKAGGTNIAVMSPFEYAAQRSKPEKESYFICNSLSVRQHWIANFGGRGIVPSAIYNRKRSAATEHPVLLISHDHMNRNLWQIMVKFRETL